MGRQSEMTAPSEHKPQTDAEQLDVLREANRQCIARTTPLIRMLGQCKQQFTLYAESHRAKNTDEGNQKAETNQALADQIDQTLKEFQNRNQETEDATE